jgi:tetratricopeptide (TPR) repeat protein
MNKPIGATGFNPLRTDRRSSSAAGRPSFAEWLLRPLVDLQPCVQGPLCARGIEYYWLALACPDRPRFILQRILPRRFRNLLLTDAGLRNYIVNDPRKLNAALRTTRWDYLCQRLDDWHTLGPDLQCRVALILQAICFYSPILALIPQISEAQVAADPDHAELAYRRACARYVLGLGNRVATYGHADLSELKMIARSAPRDHPVALNAAMMILVHKAKVGEPVEELDAWRTQAERNLESLVSKRDGFDSALLLSRFHRAAAFIPQRNGDRKQVTELMELAEKYALAVVPADESQKLLQLENLYPILESRTKEALWLGDLDLALVRAKRLIELDGYDSRAWLELGEVRLRRAEYAPAAEAYVVAAILGPPSSAIARHMAGLCFRHLGHPFLAAFFYKGAIETDASAISPHDQIHELPNLPILAALKQWSLSNLDG